MKEKDVIREALTPKRIKRFAVAWYLDIIHRMSFKFVESKINKKEGIPMRNAGAILASASRNASAAAKRKNPALKKVK